MAAAGNLDRAETTARNINDPDRRAEALVEVVAAIAAAGNLDRAETTARSITDLASRAAGLARVAEVAGLPRAYLLIGEVFAVGSWLLPLPALAKLRPQLVLEIAGEVFGDNR
ncbi:hypothetical protein [Dactylosporangium darangshiense]